MSKCIYKPCENEAEGTPACSFDHFILHQEIASGNLFSADRRASGMGRYVNICDEVTYQELLSYAN